jgi:hypothetical protein
MTWSVFTRRFLSARATPSLSCCTLKNLRYGGLVYFLAAARLCGIRGLPEVYSAVKPLKFFLVILRAAGVLAASLAPVTY